MEDDWYYRQALLDEGYDPDDPHMRAAIADIVALLQRIGRQERKAAQDTDYPVPPSVAGGSSHTYRGSQDG